MLNQLQRFAGGVQCRGHSSRGVTMVVFQVQTRRGSQTGNTPEIIPLQTNAHEVDGEAYERWIAAYCGKITNTPLLAFKCFICWALLQYNRVHVHLSQERGVFDSYPSGHGRPQGITLLYHHVEIPRQWQGKRPIKHGLRGSLALQLNISHPNTGGFIAETVGCGGTSRGSPVLPQCLLPVYYIDPLDTYWQRDHSQDWELQQWR